MELLQLATLLMRNLPSIMANHRKELIKFGWNHLKREDSSNKYHAFLNVCYFLEAYQAPEKIVLQVSCQLCTVSLACSCNPSATDHTVCCLQQCCCMVYCCFCSAASCDCCECCKGHSSMCGHRSMPHNSCHLPCSKITPVWVADFRRH